MLEIRQHHSLQRANALVFYLLYDNGRSLFYEDTEEMVERAVNDIVGYSTSFGYSGTYWDYVLEIAEERDIADLIDLSISKAEIESILKQAGFASYRLYGAAEWITKAIELLKAKATV